MPLLPGKGQRVTGDLIETLVVARERANALDIDDDVGAHRAGEDRSRSRSLNRSMRAAYASRPRIRGSRCFGLGQWTLRSRALNLAWQRCEGHADLRARLLQDA